jgi:hypothetical protein
MFAFILDILNGAYPLWNFFVPPSVLPQRPYRKGTSKPWGSSLDPPAIDRQGSPPLGAMDLDPPCTAGNHRPVELSGPLGLASLPSTLVEEQDPVAIYLALASTLVRSFGFPPLSTSLVPSGPPTPCGLSLELDSSTLNIVVS